MTGIAAPNCDPRQAGRAILIVLATLLGAWLVWSACAGQQPALTAEQERGRALYTQYCVQCHGGATGGKLTDIPPPHNASGHTWHHPDQQLAQIILEGLAFSTPGQQQMPAFKDKLTDDDVKAILAYIKTWWTEEQRTWQASVTQRYEEGLRQQRGGAQ